MILLLLPNSVVGEYLSHKISTAMLFPCLHSFEVAVRQVNLCLRSSDAFSVLKLPRYAILSIDRGWSPPYNRLGQADDSYATTAVAVGLSQAWWQLALAVCNPWLDRRTPRWNQSFSRQPCGCSSLLSLR